MASAMFSSAAQIMVGITAKHISKKLAYLADNHGKKKKTAARKSDSKKSPKDQRLVQIFQKSKHISESVYQPFFKQKPHFFTSFFAPVILGFQGVVRDLYPHAVLSVKYIKNIVNIDKFRDYLYT